MIMVIFLFETMNLLAVLNFTLNFSYQFLYLHFFFVYMPVVIWNLEVGIWKKYLYKS